MIGVRFLDKSLQSVVAAPNVQFRVLRYSHAAPGGPQQAEIAVSGDEFGLWQLASMLRCGVEIYDGDRGVVWWGYVAELSLAIGAIGIGFNLDRMSNRAAVAYTFSEPGVSGGGERRTTAWSENTDSVATYGIKEALVGLSDATDAQAIFARDAVLARRASPTPTISPSPGAGATELATATLYCRGWWDTLKWRFWSAPALGISYAIHTESTSGSIEWEINESNPAGIGLVATPQRAQSFLTPIPLGFDQPIPITSVRLILRRYGSPIDDVCIDLYTSAGGVPGTLMATASISAADVSDSGDSQYTFDFPDGVALLSNEVYWIVARRSGTADNTHYVAWITDTAASFAGGEFRSWNGSAWVLGTTDARFSVHWKTSELSCELGARGSMARIAQKIRNVDADGWEAAQITIWAARCGTPGDSLVIDICSDAAGASVLASASVSGGVLTSTPSPIVFNFPSPATLPPATDRWLVVRRSGAANTIDFYRLAVNDAAGYADGDLRAYNGSTWYALGADLLFVVGGATETTRQIANIVNFAGQFITAIDIETPSGIYTNPYHSGDEDAQMCINKLLQAGTSGGQRLTALVTSERRVRVFAEPALGAADYYLLRDGRLVDAMDSPIHATRCPVAVWARLRDLSASGALATDPQAFALFIEGNEYQATEDRAVIRARDSADAFDLWELR